MSIIFVYVAVLEEEVLTVQTLPEKLLEFVNDYFGISKTKTYSNPATYLGYTKIDYGEYADDLHGYHSYEDEDGVQKVYVFCKKLDETAA